MGFHDSCWELGEEQQGKLGAKVILLVRGAGYVGIWPSLEWDIHKLKETPFAVVHGEVVPWRS